MKHRARVAGIPILFASAAIVACSGGGNQSVPAAAVPAIQTVPVTFTVALPSPILSAGAQSIAIAFVPVGDNVPSPPPTLVIEVKPGSADCAAGNGKTICRGTLNVPAGQQNFTLSVYAQPGGQGAQLTVKSLVETVAAPNSTFDVSNANGAVGILASVELVLTPPTITYGVASTVIVSIVPKDPSGNTLAGALAQPVSIVIPPTPAPPGVPIFLAPPTPLPEPGTVDASGNSTILIASQQYAYAYSGTLDNLAPQITFEAIANTIPAALAYVAVAGLPTPQPSPTAAATPTLPPLPPPIPLPTAGPIGVLPNVLLFEAPAAPVQTFSAGETGFTTFTAVSSDPSVATVNSNGTMFTVTPHNAGSAAITVSDSAGRTGTVFVYVSHVVLTIQQRGRRK